MGTLTLTPASLIVDTNFINTGGAASKIAALTDASDATYLRGPVNAGRTLHVAMPVTGLPDGAAIAQVTPVVRYMAAGVAGASGFSSRTWARRADATEAYGGVTTGILTASTITDRSTVVIGAYNPTSTADAIADIAVSFSLPGQAPFDLNLYKLSGTLDYVQAPTAASLAIDSGQLNTTQKPVHTYTYTSPEGVAFYELQAATWLVSDLASYPGGQAAFEADPEAAFRDAAGVGAPSFTGKAAKAWTTNPDTNAPGWSRPSQSTSWTPDQPLPFTGAMKTYLRVAATYAGNRLSRKNAAGVSTLAFTMAVTPPAAPTSLTAVWAGAPAYRGQITVAMPADSLSRRLYVERSTNGVTWFLLPLGYRAVTAGAQSVVFYDPAYAPGTATTYRARTGHPTLETYSAYVTSSAATTGAIEFLLRDPLDDATVPPCVLRWQGDFEASAEEVLGESRGLGAGLPSFTSDAITGQRWSAELLVVDEDSYVALRRLRARRVTMVLHTDMTGSWYWVRFGSSWKETIIRQIERRVASRRTRRVTCELIETYPIAGQPTPAELRGS